MSAHVKIKEDWGQNEQRREYQNFWNQLRPTVTDVVTKSFDSHPVRHLTNNEVSRRTDAAKALVDLMRFQLRWSVPRIRDTLPIAFSAQLSGLVYDLEALGRRSAW